MIKETLRASEGLAKVKRITDVKKKRGGWEEGDTSQRQRLLNTGRKKIITVMVLAYLRAALRLANLGGQQKGLLVLSTLPQPINTMFCCF